jgi:hypothetical protein
VREISRTTVSSKSPRQVVKSSCVRTAGVGSTGMNAAGFTAGVSKSVASVASPVASVASVASPAASVASVESPSVVSAFVASVASVASQFTVTGALRPSPSVLSSSVSSGFVASSSPPRDRCESRSGPSHPVALLGRQLRQAVSRSSQSSALVLRRVRGPSVASPEFSVGIRVSSVASSGVRVGCVESSPKLVLRQAFQKSVETARDGLCRRLSRRFAGKPLSCSGSKPQSGRVVADCVEFASVASASSSVASCRVTSISVASRSVH